MAKRTVTTMVVLGMVAACGPMEGAAPVTEAPSTSPRPDVSVDGSEPGSTGPTQTDVNPGTSGGGTPASSTDDGTDPTDPTDPGTTPATTTTDGCPAGVICVDTFPYVDTSTTTGAVSSFDSYSCAPSTDESGPEVVYEVQLDEAGFLATEVYGLPAGVDVDVHVLDALDPDACVDRGHWAAGALMMPGTYYVVVDSWVDGSGVAYDGDYTVGINVVTRDTFEADGLDPVVLERALWAFDGAWFDDQTDRFIYGVIDFGMPSTLPRMFIMDLLTDEMIYAVHTTHGEGSGDPNDITMASTFSNVHESHQSSLGMVKAAETYYGTWGYSLRLDGLDPIYNDQVRSRAIVIHPADYATQDFVDDYGYLGRSWGCPAVDPAISAGLIDTIADGALLLAYYPSNDFLSAGRYISGY
jgi:hypothetical protein